MVRIAILSRGIGFIFAYKNDETLYNYLTEVYATTGYLELSDTDIAALVIENLVGILSEMEIANNFRYSIYVDSAGYILSNEIAFEVAPYYEEDLPVSVNLKFDTAGKDYLLDETKFAMSVGDEEDSINTIVSSIGHNVPNNGVFDSDITVKAYTNDTYEDEDSSDMFGLFGHYTWDTNKLENNFSFTFSASDDLASYATNVPKDNENLTRFTMNGKVST